MSRPQGGRFERAIQLAGFLSAQRPYGRVTVRSVGSQLAEHAQQRLGSDRAAAVWAQGEAMTIADAAAFSLDENVARPAIIPSKPDRRCLTQREMQVLGLVARGKSNKEIAAALVVSTRTVERHIENVYAKIGTSGRAGAAAYAVRQSLDYSRNALVVPAPPVRNERWVVARMEAATAPGNTDGHPRDSPDAATQRDQHPANPRREPHAVRFGAAGYGRERLNSHEQDW